MRKNSLKGGIWILLMGLLLGGLSQQPRFSREELENRIGLTEELLSETRVEEQQTIGALRLLNEQIQLRRQLLMRLTEEIYAQQAEMERLEQITREIEADQQQITENYVRVIQATYKNLGSDQLWMSLLTADNLTDAFFRLQYFRWYTTYRKEQLELMAKTREDLAIRRKRLAEETQQKAELQAYREQELLSLETDRSQQQRMFQQLKRQAAAYQMALDEARLQLTQLIRESESLYNTSEQTSTDSYAENFPQQIGQLPWPVPFNRAIIAGTFGRTEDAYGNTIINDGIYLQTARGEQVRAVYAGRVTGVSTIPMNGGIVVIVEHGNYRTIYANLERTYVKKGDLLIQGQTVGLVRTEPRTGETLLNFLIYAVPNKFVDPEKWLLKPGNPTD